MAFRVDVSRLGRRLAGVRAGRVGARTLAAREMGGNLIEQLDRNSHRDTRRYVRAWIQAGRQAGVSSLPMPPIGPAKAREKWMEVLTRQLRSETAYLKFLEDRKRVWYDQHPEKLKHGFPPYLKKLQGWIKKQETRVQRSAEELKKYTGTDTAIIINAFRAKGKLATVRDKVYGGSGRLSIARDTTTLELKNLEAHARIVERKFHTLSRSESGVRGVGIRRASAKYLKEIQQAHEMAA